MPWIKTLLFISCFLNLSCKEKLPDKKDRFSVFNMNSSIIINPDLQSIKNINTKSNIQESSIYTGKYADYEYFGKFNKMHKINIGSDNFSYYFVDNSPILYKNYLFVIDGTGDIWKYNTQTKSKKRIFKHTQVNFEYATINIYNNEIFYNSNNGLLLKMGLDGIIKWQKFDKQYCFRGGVSIEDDVIYGYSCDNRTIALDISQGNEIWNLDLKNSFHNNDISNNLIHATPPIIIDDYIFQTNIYNEIAVISKTGKNIYNIDIQPDKTAFGDNADSNININNPLYPALNADKLIFASSYLGPFHVINKSTFNILDKKNFGLKSPIVNSLNFIYFINNRNELTAMHIATGQIKWVKKLQEFHDYTLPKYLTNGKGYKRLKLNWRGPVIVNDNILLTSPFGKMLLINIENGETLRNITIPECIFSAPIVKNGKITFYSPCKNTIYQFY